MVILKMHEDALIGPAIDALLTPIEKSLFGDQNDFRFILKNCNTNSQ